MTKQESIYKQALQEIATGEYYSFACKRMAESALTEGEPKGASYTACTCSEQTDPECPVHGSKWKPTPRQEGEETRCKRCGKVNTNKRCCGTVPAPRQKPDPDRPNTDGHEGWSKPRQEFGEEKMQCGQCGAIGRPDLIADRKCCKPPAPAEQSHLHCLACDAEVPHGDPVKPAPSQEKCKNCGWPVHGLCTDKTKGCGNCGFKGNSREVAEHACIAAKVQPAEQEDRYLVWCCKKCGSDEACEHYKSKPDVVLKEPAAPTSFWERFDWQFPGYSEKRGVLDDRWASDATPKLVKTWLQIELKERLQGLRMPRPLISQNDDWKNAVQMFNAKLDAVEKELGLTEEETR